MDSGIVHDRAARLQLAGRFGRIDDGDAEAVLDAGGGVVELQFREHGGAESLGDLVQAHQRGVSEDLGDVVVDALRHGLRFLFQARRQLPVDDDFAVPGCQRPRGEILPDYDAECPRFR
jgi:hypothetical protein